MHLARAADGVAGFGQRLLVAIAAADLGLSTGQFVGGRQADAAVTGGDDGRLVRE